jgi:hypothetical protein
MTFAPGAFGLGGFRKLDIFQNRPYLGTVNGMTGII